MYKAGLIFLFVLLFGVAGFMFLVDYELVDAFYMTVITMSTVGFREVVALDTTGKIFTIFLIIFSVGAYAYLVAAVANYIANDRSFDELKKRNSLRKIKKLKGHTVVCGFGRNGRQAAMKLVNYNQTCVVIERDEDLKEEIESLGYLMIVGDPTDDGVLEEANLEQASSLITSLPSDADNLFVVLSAKQLNSSLRIVSRASQETSVKKLKIAGADNVIMPDRIGGDHMASLLVTPDLVEFVSRISIEGDHTANLEEINVNDLPDTFIGKTIKELDMRQRSGCNVIGYIDGNENYVINPEPSQTLTANGRLIVLGNTKQIAELKSIFDY
ncbi:MAG: potassium channel family protein [Flavobacteriaceae bacterium]